VHDVFYSGADVVVPGGKKDLGFVFHPPEGIGVDNGGGVPEVVSPQVGFIVGPRDGAFFQLVRGEFVPEEEVVAGLVTSGGVVTEY